jgi:hypothetical protein
MEIEQTLENAERDPLGFALERKWEGRQRLGLFVQIERSVLQYVCEKKRKRGNILFSQRIKKIPIIVFLLTLFKKR